MNRPTHAAAGTKRAARHFDAHHRFIIACGLAVLTFTGLHGHTAYSTQLAATWDVFALSIVVMAWYTLSTKDPYEVRRDASLQDTSRTFLFIAVISAALVSLCAVFILLGPAKDLPPGRFTIHILVSVGAIVLSWTLVHTLFSLRYAHFYYIDAHEVNRDDVEGGLIFPGEQNPDYLDFAYFSFIIGMTCQVSDVQISSKKMRRLATIHGLISFAFNTAILAMFVNIVAGLI
ncbi:MAG TPA: DUF1345 domain-containing protein [Candidatus Methylacidiphilales bacterium]|nr:DUF1345 domain-containing protein [Candidatus Methylacidiphilales bacterium]